MVCKYILGLHILIRTAHYICILIYTLLLGCRYRQGVHGASGVPQRAPQRQA